MHVKTLFNKINSELECSLGEKNPNKQYHKLAKKTIKTLFPGLKKQGFISLQREPGKATEQMKHLQPWIC